MTRAILDGGRAKGSASHALAALAVRLREVEQGVDEGVLAGARAAVNLLPLAFALIALSSSLAAAAIAALVAFGIGLGVVRRRFRAGHAKAAAAAEALHRGLDELVRHLDLWRVFGASARVRETIATASEQAGRASARADAAKSALSGANEVLAAAALVVVVAAVERGGIAIDRGAVVAFATVFFLMYRPLRDLGDARGAIDRGAEALADLERAFVASGESARTATPEAPRAWDPATLEVRAVRVRSGEWSTPPTSVVAAPGEIVALVGPTGIGKSTFVRALLGLEPSAEGSVVYGGVDVSAAGVGPGERPFAWVPQEAAIVAGTLEENVLLGAAEGASARDALEMIGARSLLDRGLEMRLTAGGADLSGGERQWVAIARAIASGLPVLLLDEPTSGLDRQSQAAVLASLEALRDKRTIVIVTHRAEPLRIATAIVEMA